VVHDYKGTKKVDRTGLKLMELKEICKEQGGESQKKLNRINEVTFNNSIEIVSFFLNPVCLNIPSQF